MSLRMEHQQIASCLQAMDKYTVLDHIIEIASLPELFCPSTDLTH